MEHIGIDLGACHSHVAILNDAGKQIAQRKIRTGDLPRWFKKRSQSHIVIETCTQSAAIAVAGEDAGHTVTVVPGHLVRAIGVGSRGIKTDERDALVLARASHRIPDLPGVHLRSVVSKEIRLLLNARTTLVNSRKVYATTCKAFLRARLQQIKGRANSKYFADAVRTIALEHPEGLPSSIDALLSAYVQTCDLIETLDAEIEEIIASDSVAQNLMSMPGVGPQVALSFKTQVDDPHRFPSADHLGSYLGLTPGEATTGGKVKRTGTLRAGPRQLKGLFVQGAWAMWRCRPNDPLVLWARVLANKRGKRIAIVALARKMAVILWSMWKNDTGYDPRRASRFRLPAEPEGYAMTT